MCCAEMHLLLTYVDIVTCLQLSLLTNLNLVISGALSL
jgi:hypothetical protein